MTMVMGEDKVQIESEEGDGTTRTRIYVGGLGCNVTEDDLRKTFSSLGKVESVDIVRTKGRSFAYLDFLPSSDKSLSKLFSTYNGCMWKGGRLRLEKAKENYLLRLRREWTEDAELASNPPSYKVEVSENMSSLEKQKKLSTLEKKQLRIFFPKLMKMKLMPFSGTGKHKYSFQRIEVPSLPIHFCDCDEHSDPCDVAKVKPLGDLETKSVGMNQEELNMMKSVMNKLFERENCPNVACSEAGLAKEGDSSVDSIDDVLVDENEADSGTDEDNLIINVVAGENDRIALLESWGQETSTAYQESKFNKAQTSKHRAAQKTRERHGNTNAPYDKKRKLPLAEESDGNEITSSIPGKKRSSQFHIKETEDQTTEPGSGTHQSMGNFSWSQKSTWRDLVGERGNNPFHISHIMPSDFSAKEEQPKIDNLDVPHSAEIENQNLVKHGNSESQLSQSEELKELAEASPVIPNADLNKYARGTFWKQKSSWTQLVGNANNSPFSISQILPDLTFEKQDVLQPICVHAANLKNNEQHNLLKSDRSQPVGDCSKALRVANKDDITAPCASNVTAVAKKELKLQTVMEKNDVSPPKLGKKDPLAVPKQTSVGEFGIGETCSFMRSDASMKEWMKTKAALTGSLKKKGNEK